jgi:hypothetical protein
MSDIERVKSKVERILNDFFDDTPLFNSLGRDSYGSSIFEFSYGGKTFKIYGTVDEIEQFNVLGKDWSFLDLPKFQLTLSVRISGNLKSGVALYNFVNACSRTQKYTKIYSNKFSAGGAAIWLESTLVADTIDPTEVRNALVHLLLNIQDTSDNLPWTLRL